MTDNEKKLRYANNGRPKGATNKMTKALKDMILGALDDVGGQDYLARQAEENPVAFMGLIGKILPNQIKADIDAKTDSTLTVQIVKYGDYNPAE